MSGSEITVQSNDVAFAVHAFILSLITLLQIGYYNGIRAVLPSRVIAGSNDRNPHGTPHVPYDCGNLEKVNMARLFILFKLHQDICFAYQVHPQVILNMKRKSTVGWSIWNILLDFTGGILSVLQLVLDCASMGIGLESQATLPNSCWAMCPYFFDVIFMLQHYVLYHESSRNRALLVRRSMRTNP
jgi:cystinosin